MNVQTVELDVSKKPNHVNVIYIGTNDRQAPTLNVSVLDHGDAIDLDGMSVFFEMRRPSGGKYSVEGVTSGNVATFVLSGIEQGVTDIAYVAIVSDDFRLSTQRFRVEVLEGSD